jgi:hypothetical protein
LGKNHEINDDVQNDEGDLEPFKRERSDFKNFSARLLMHCKQPENCKLPEEKKT